MAEAAQFRARSNRLCWAAALPHSSISKKYKPVAMQMRFGNATRSWFRLRWTVRDRGNFSQPPVRLNRRFPGR